MEYASPQCNHKKQQRYKKNTPTPLDLSTIKKGAKYDYIKISAPKGKEKEYSRKKCNFNNNSHINSTANSTANSTSSSENNISTPIHRRKIISYVSYSV